MTGKGGLAAGADPSGFPRRPLHSLRRGCPRRHVHVVTLIRELQHDLMAEHVVLRAKTYRIAAVFEIPRLPGIGRPFAFGPKIRQRHRILNKYLHIMFACQSVRKLPPAGKIPIGMREPGTSFSENDLTAQIINRVSAY